jgi:hypothetical protein
MLNESEINENRKKASCILLFGRGARQAAEEDRKSEKFESAGNV